MLEDLSSATDIDRHIDQLLKRADAYGRHPTPVDDIVAASGLMQSPEFELDEGLLAKMPKQARLFVRRNFRGVRGALNRKARILHVAEHVTHQGQKNFVKLHEVTHYQLPWQQDLIHTDNGETLSPSTRNLFEREANQGAAELLFQRCGFTREAARLTTGTDAVEYLAQLHGSSLRATFRRYAETHRDPVHVLCLGPQPDANGNYTHQETPCSTGWRTRFGRPTYPWLLRTSAYPFLAGIDHALNEAPMNDLSGARVSVRVETLNTGFAQFVMLSVPRTRILRPIRVHRAPAAE